MVVAGALAGSLGTVAPATAQDDVQWSPGLHLVVSFGQSLRVGLGVDVRVTHITNYAGDCRPRDAWQGFGAFGQATWLIHDGVRFAAGLHVAGELEAEGWLIDAELGWSYTLERTWRAHGLQAGLLFGQFPLDLGIGRVNLSFDEGRARVEGQLGVGVRAPGILDDGGTCVIGRPLRVDGQIRLAPFVVGRARPATLGHDETRAALAAGWLEAARAEAASVPAFVALARDLVRARAPRSLVVRARAAARDEVRHARLCAALTGRAAAREVAMLCPALPSTTDESRAALLTRLALESLSDGCLGEGTSAERARRALAACREESTATALYRIARDEEAHCELAWSVLEFAFGEGGEVVREAVAAHADIVNAVADDEETRGAAEVGARTWRRLGRLDAATVDRCADAVHARTRRRLERVLSRA